MPLERTLTAQADAAAPAGSNGAYAPLRRPRFAVNNLPPAGIWAGLLLLPGLFAWLAAVLLAGGSLWQLVCFEAAFVVCLLGSGGFLVRHTVPWLAGGADELPVAFLAGCAAVFCSHSLVWALGALLPVLRGPGWLSLLPCWLLGGTEVIRRLRSVFSTSGGDRRPSDGSAGRWLSGLVLSAALSVCLGLFAVYGVLPFARPDRLKAWVYNQDMLWSIGNAASVRFGLPFGDMRAAGLRLNYHFLNDAVAGILARGTGCSAWHGLCFYWNAAVLFLGVLAFALVGRRLSAHAALAGAAVWLVWLGSTQGSTLPVSLFSNANAQSTACLALCGLLLLLDAACAARGIRQLFGCGVLGFAAFGSACMIKSPMGALVLLGFAATVVVGGCTRQLRAGAAAVTAGGVAAFGLVYLLVLGQATNNLVFTTLANITRLPAACWLYFSPVLAAAYLGGLGYSLVRFGRLSMLELAVNAIAVGSMLAYVLFQHYSFSQVYFALTAVPCVALSALPAVSRMADRLAAPAKRWAGLLLAAAVCLCFARQLWLEQTALRTGAQAALRCAGLRVSETTELTITAADCEAALWLHENTPPEAVFLSNRNNRQFDAADGVFHFYSAASERRCYIESYRYAMDYDHAYHEIRRRLEQVSDQIYTTLPQEEAFALARAEGVDYILVSRLSPQVPDWSCSPVFENELVSIYCTDAA